MANNKKGKKRSPVITIGIPILLVVGGYFVYVLFFTGSNLDTDSISSTSLRSEIEIPDLNIEILDAETLDLFRTWSVIPIIVGETGRENPFSQDFSGN